MIFRRLFRQQEVAEKTRDRFWESALQWLMIIGVSIWGYFVIKWGIGKSLWLFKIILNLHLWK